MRRDRRYEAIVRLKCRNKEGRHLNLLRSYLSRSVEADVKMIASTARSYAKLYATDTPRGYGQSNYEACISLLYGKASIRKGFSNIGAFDHAFFLRTLKRPRIPLSRNGSVKSHCPKYGVTVSLFQSNVCVQYRDTHLGWVSAK